MLTFIVSIGLLSLTSFTVKHPALAIKHSKKALISLEAFPIDLSENNFNFHSDFSGEIDDATLVSQVYAILVDRIAHIDGVGFTVSYGINDAGETLDPSKSLRENGIKNPGGMLVYGFVE